MDKLEVPVGRSNAVECPSCKAVLFVPTHLHGSKFACPSCKSEIQTTIHKSSPRASRKGK